MATGMVPLPGDVRAEEGDSSIMHSVVQQARDLSLGKLLSLLRSATQP